MSNAIDSQAKSFILTIDKEKKKISLFNDGRGISESRFEEIVSGFGRGLYRDENDPDSYFSYFGIGLLSVFKLGKRVSIFSRTSPKNMNLFTIASKSIFSKESGKKKVSELEEYFEIVEKQPSVVANKRDVLSPISLTKVYEMSKLAREHFTEFVIEEVYKEDLNALLEDHDELCEILPLEPNKKDSELIKLRDENCKEVLKVLKKETFCPTIDFYYSNTEGIYKKWNKYFPRLDISKYSKVFTGATDDFAYYVISAGKNIGEKHSLSIRSKNMLLKTNTVLEQPGPNQILDSSLRERVYGEILHKNMKEFVEVTRNEFIKNEDFTKFREAVKEKIGPINQELRSSYDKGLEVLKYVYKPFESIRREEKESPLKEIEKQIQQLSGSKQAQTIIQCAQKLFSKMKDGRLEKAKDVSDYLKGKRIIDLQGDGYILRIQKDIDEAKSEKDYNKDTTIVSIPASTFDSMEITWFKHSFKVRFVYVEGEGGPYSVDFGKRTLTINPFYQYFQSYSLNFLKVIMTLDLAFENILTDDPDCDSTDIRECLKLYKDSVVKMLTAEYKMDEEKKLGIIKRSITDELT